MKVCFLGGAYSIHIVRWVNGMVNRGHKVSLITMHPPIYDQIDRRVEIYKLKVPAPMGYFLNKYEVKWIIKKIKPDIVNTHYASGYGTLSRYVNFKPTLLSVWGSDVFSFPYESAYKLKILKKNLESATQIASTSLIMKKQVEKFLSPQNPIVITPFGIDMDIFQAKLKSKETITIGTVKKLEEIYGIRYIIEAFALLIKKLKESNNEDYINKLHLLIVGGGSQLGELKDLTRKLDIEGLTTFTGAVPHSEVPDYLNKLDIYCAPSLRESFGVAVIEASACEVPVIVSNVGGLPEVVKDNETGFIVESRNSNQIAEKLFQLVLDSDKRIKLGKEGRRFVGSVYNWVDNVSQMEKIYENMVNNK